MEADQIFGRIEKDVRKYETIISPDTYRDIFKKHGRVRSFLQHWRSFDYKKLSDSAFKKNSGFRISLTKRWLLKRKCTTVWCSNFYHGPYMAYDLLKANTKKRLGVKAPLLPTTSRVKDEKKKDVMFLLDTMGVSVEEREWYTNTL